MGSLNIDTSTIEAIIQFLIAWGPTIFASIALIIGFFIGCKRGARKSLILLIHAAVCFTICFTVYLILVESRDFDKFLLDTTNMIIGSESGLEDLLGVSAECETVREVIIEFIPTQLSFMDGLELVAKDNGAYLLTIVDMVYRIVFAIILNIIYLVLIFIAYIIYLIFYSERKYIKKQNLDYQNDLSDGLYRKNRFLGGVIGFARSFVTVTLVLSFVGSFFFVVTGGPGDEDAPKPEFEDETVSLITSAYSSICEYGSQGIFKILNLVKDEKNVPYYLYAADLIYQGGLKDGEIDKDVVFREEFAAYIGFARKTYDLLIKYGSEELIPILEGKSDEDIMDAVVEVMTKKAFQVEFENIIKDFEKESYFINFALSLCESMIKNINDIELLSVLPEETREILQICFSDGYLSPNIPYEAKLLAEKETDPYYEYQKDKYHLGSLKLSSLITREDIIELLQTLFDVITTTQNYNEEATDGDSSMFTINLISNIIDHVGNLSILSTNRANEVNPVLRRLYSYLEVTYLSVSLEAETPEYASYTSEAPYTGNEYNEVLWIEEIQMLINIIKKGLNLYQNNFANIPPDTDVMDVVIGIFDDENPNYAENMNSLDYVLTSLANSRILGDVLSTSFGNSMLESILGSVVEGFTLPEDVNYSNIYDKNGDIVEYGELYHLFSVVKKVITEPEFMAQIGSLLSTPEEGEPQKEFDLNTIFDLLNIMTSKGKDGLSALDCVVKSNILRSLISSILIDLSSGEDSLIYLDSSVLDEDNLIKLEELEKLFDVIPDVVPIIKEVIDKFAVEEESTVPETQSDESSEDSTEEPEEESDIEYLLGLLKDPVILKVLDSKIIEGTISNLAFSYLPEDMIVIPTAIKERQKGVVTSNEGKSEIRKLISVLNDSSVDISGLLSGEINSDAILEIITSLTENDFDLVFASDILHYTIYNFLINAELSGFEVIVPNSVKVNLSNDVFDSIIPKDRLIDLVKSLLLLLPEEEASEPEDSETPENPENPDDSQEPTEEDSLINSILLNLVLNKDRLAQNEVIIATVANALVNTNLADDLGILEIPNVLKKAATIEELTIKFGPNNPWYKEIDALVTALDEILEISENGEINLEDIESVVINSITTLNDDSSISGQTKLDLLYNSLIVTNLLATSIDELMVGQLLDEKDAKALKDYNGNYLKSEISSIIYLIKVFKITDEELKDENSYDNIMNKVKGGLNSLIEDDALHLKTLYENKIFGMLLYNVVSDLLSIPTDALMTTSTGTVIKSIRYEEAYALISSIDIFGSIEEINPEAVDLNAMREKIDIISESTIISGYIYEMIGSSEDVLIPYYTLNDNRTAENKYIKQKEFAEFLKVVTNPKISGLLFEPNGDKYDLTTIKQFDFEEFAIEDLKLLTNSTILNVTMVNVFVDFMESNDLTSSLPSVYTQDYSKTRLLVKHDNVWIVNNEMEKVISILEILEIQELFNTDIEAEILKFLDDEKDKKPFDTNEDGKEYLELLYESILVKSAISKEIDKILTPEYIDAEVRDSLAVREKEYREVYAYHEIGNFVKSMQKLGISFETVDTVDFGIEVLQNNNDAEEIYNSILVKGIIATQVNKEISNGDFDIKMHPKAYDEDLRDNYDLHLYKWGEIDVLLSLLPEDFDSFDINSISLIELRSKIFDENDNYKSYILAATLTENAKEGLVVLREDLDADGLLKPSATLAMLDGLKALGIDHVEFDVDEMKLPNQGTEAEIKAKLTTIANSNILNATIICNIEFNVPGESGEPYIAKAYNDGTEQTYVIKPDYEGIPAAILTVDEFVKLGETITAIVPEDESLTSLNINVLQVGLTILGYDSQVMCNFLVEYLIANHRATINKIPSINIFNYEGVKLRDCHKVTISQMSKENAGMILAALSIA